MILLAYDKLRKITAVTVALPVVTFLFGYLKPVIAIPGALVFLAAVYLALKSRTTEPDRDRTVTITPAGLAAVVAVILLWGWLGGLNGFFFQSSDWGARNAIYRDLIGHTWPVVYEQKMTSLAYYIGHWLVPAALSKPVFALFGEGVGWVVARMLLWLWTSFILVLIALDLMVYTNADKRWKKVLCLVCLIGFSGMDAVGAWVTDRWREVTAADVLHFEWWRKDYQFSSMTTCLYWVFNQAVIPWLIVMNVLFEADPRCYMFWGVCCFLCGPFPFVGLALLMGVKAGAFMVRKARAGEGKEALRALVSPGNVLLLATLFPALAMFFLSNNAAAGGLISGITNRPTGVSFLYAFQDSVRIYLRKFLHVYVLDVGVYLWLVCKRRKRDPVFYAVALSLFILPFFRVGKSLDFAARSTIPGVFVLMVYVLEEGLVDVERWREFHLGEKFRGLCLLGVFLVGLMTPGMEIYRGIYNVCHQGTVQLEDDSVHTLENQPVSLNFETTMFTDSAFFKYLAKRPRTDSVAVAFADGFTAGSDGERLAGTEAALTLYNGWKEPQHVRLSLHLAPEEGGGPFTVTVSHNGQTWDETVTEAGQNVRWDVTLEDMGTRVSLSAPVPYRVTDVRLLDGDGTVLASAPTA